MTIRSEAEKMMSRYLRTKVPGRPVFKRTAYMLKQYGHQKLTGNSWYLRMVSSPLFSKVSARYKPVCTSVNLVSAELRLVIVRDR